MLYLYHQSGSEIALHFPKNTPSIFYINCCQIHTKPTVSNCYNQTHSSNFCRHQCIKEAANVLHSITRKKAPIQNNFSQDRPSKKPQLFVADCKIIVRELLIIARFAAFAMIVKPSHNFLLFCCRVAIDKEKLLTEY